MDVQIKGLSAWVNSYLAQSKAKGVTKIEDLAQDMKNGVVRQRRAATFERVWLRVTACTTHT